MATLLWGQFRVSSPTPTYSGQHYRAVQERCRAHAPPPGGSWEGGESAPSPTSGGGGEGRGDLSLALPRTWQMRGCSQLSHTIPPSANSPEPPPTGSSMLYCLGEKQSPLFLTATAGKWEGRRWQGARCQGLSLSCPQCKIIENSTGCS